MAQAIRFVQGLNPKEYIAKAISHSNFDVSMYDSQAAVPTELILDRMTPGILAPIPGIDRLLDLQYFFREEVKTACQDAIANSVGKEIKQGRAVDIIAHSLGTCMVLNSSVKVRDVYLIGSPVAMVGALGNLVRDRVRKDGLNLQCERLFYIYSPVDLVCHHYNKKVQRLLKKYNVIPVVSDSKHSIVNYLDEAQVIRDLQK